MVHSSFVVVVVASKSLEEVAEGYHTNLPMVVVLTSPLVVSYVEVTCLVDDDPCLEEVPCLEVVPCLVGTYLEVEVPFLEEAFS